FHDLLGVRFRQRAAEHGEVLGEQVDGAAVDRAPAGDDAVAGDFLLLHAEFGRAVLDEHVELLERALVEQQFDALARGQFASAVLGRDALFAAAQTGLAAPLFEPVEDVFHAPCPYGIRLRNAYHDALSAVIAGLDPAIHQAQRQRQTYVRP